MSKHMRGTFVKKLVEQGVLPTYHNSDPETAKKIAEALADGGSKVIEFTNRGDRAHEIFKELAIWRDEEHPEIVLGTGSIYDPTTAALYIDNGADFVVGPISNAEVANICWRRKVPYVPGCFTPSEISSAERMGADVIKVFPASVLGPSFIKAVRGPSSRSRLMPSGGVKVDRENLEGWFNAGVVAVNIGSDLIRKDLVEARDFDGIAERTGQCISIIEKRR